MKMSRQARAEGAAPCFFAGYSPAREGADARSGSAGAGMRVAWLLAGAAALVQMPPTAATVHAAYPGSQSSKHLNQSSRDSLRSLRRYRAQLPGQALPVYRADLVQGHLSPFALERHSDAGRIGALGGCHGSDDDGPQMPIDFVG